MQTAIPPRYYPQFAKLAGVSLLLMVPLAGIGYGYAFENLYSTSATLHLSSTKPLLRIAITSFLLIVLLDILVAWAFYYLFEQVNRPLSLLAAWVRLVYSALLAVSVFQLNTPLVGPTEATPDPTIIRYHLDAFKAEWSIALQLFGCHLIILGILLLKSQRVPKFVSLSAVFAGLCYWISNFAIIIVPDYHFYQTIVDNILAVPMALGELILAVWLLRTNL
jgi:hypothetical protein